MDRSRSFLSAMGLPTTDCRELPASKKRFGDGGQYRVEIPSVEGPQAMSTVIDAAASRDVPLHRVSQGSGAMMLSGAEIQHMVELGQEHGVEVCLFVGPRAGWDIGAQVTSLNGKVLGASLRGADQLVYGLEDVLRASDLGVRSMLVADLGLLWVLGRMKAAGDLPADFVLKVSVSLPVANPATARLLEDLGATSLNLPVDLPLGSVAAIREAVDAPIDLYIEGPDDFGGPVRYYDIPELVRVAAPIYLKFTVRNAPNTYPSGQHLAATVQALSEERVRRAAIGLELLRRHYPAAAVSPIAGGS